MIVTSSQATPSSADTAAQAPTTGRRWLISCGHFFFKYRDFVFPIVFLAVVLLSPPLRPFGSPRWELVSNLLGVAIALSGQLLRALVIGFAYIRRGGLNKNIYADSLVREGFFAHSRNPLYVGNLLGLAGFLVIHNSWAGYLVAMPFFLFAYLAIVAAEEDYLGRRFGDEYRDYCQKVNRFLPSLRGIGESVAGMGFDWKRLIRKEYGSTFTGLTCVLALWAWDAWRQLGSPAAEPVLRGVLIAWVPVVLAWLVARVLKKRGALGHG